MSVKRIDIKDLQIIKDVDQEVIDWFDKELVIGGWKNPARPDLERGLLLYAICKKLNAKNVLDIGSANFYSAKAMAKWGCKVLTIDIKPQKLRGNDELHPLITHLAVDSTKLLPLLKDKQFDLIFIDGSHDYEPVKQDISNSMRLSDTIVCHDYGNIPDVTKAINEIIKPTYYIADDRLWYGAAYEKSGIDKGGEPINYGLVIHDSNNLLTNK